MMTTDITGTAAEPSAIPEARIAVFGAPGDPHLIAEILCDLVHLHRTDAVIQAHYAPAVLPLELTWSQAEAVVEKIRGLGIQAAVVRSADLPDFEQSTTIHHARLPATGWEIVDYRGDVAEVIPWSELSVIAVGEVPLPEVTRYPEVRQAIVTTAPQPPMGRMTTADTTGPELWVIRQNPLSVYRIEHRAMNYECLGDRRTDSATANFRAYLADFVRLATGTWLTPSTRAYLQHELRPHYAFPDSAHLQRHALLNWVMRQVSLSK
ncbi:hypothetical protein GC163_01355 [bacterium]|nr:hypothetical protein [bacterium]